MLHLKEGLKPHVSNLTRKQKKAKESREKDMLSDIEILDIILGGNSLERDESELSNSGRRPDSPRYNNLMNQDTNSHPNSREGCSQNGQILRENGSSSESTDCQES